MKTVPEKVIPKVEKATQSAKKPFVSIVVPAFNEASIVEKNLTILCQYMESLEDEYRWEIIFVNDGSTDETGKLAEAFARTRDNIHVLQHLTNFQLGQALKFAFNYCKGDYVVTIDIDLSYSPQHIVELLKKIKETRAKIVIASPYMKGGKVSNVPWLRRILSKCANRFLSLTAHGNLSTFTSMVRVYDGKFLRALNLKAIGMEVNSEIIYKAMVLRARIEEIPAHLDWALQKAEGIKRRSSMKILRTTISYLMSGFIFRPFMFFIIPGLIITLLSLYSFIFVFMHVFNFYQDIALSVGSFDYRLGVAVAAAFSEAPHAFVISGISLMVAIQLISLGILSLQSKHYFEEIFHLGTTIYRCEREHEKYT